MSGLQPPRDLSTRPLPYWIIPLMDFKKAVYCNRLSPTLPRLSPQLYPSGSARSGFEIGANVTRLVTDHRASFPTRIPRGISFALVFSYFPRRIDEEVNHPRNEFCRDSASKSFQVKSKCPFLFCQLCQKDRERKGEQVRFADFLKISTMSSKLKEIKSTIYQGIFHECEKSVDKFMSDMTTDCTIVRSR